jgi:hypothetical protein
MDRCYFSCLVVLDSLIIGAPVGVHSGSNPVVFLPDWSLSSPHLAVHTVFFIRRFKYKIDRYIH